MFYDGTRCTPMKIIAYKTVFPDETKMAEGVGFEPTVELPLLLISSQMPLTTQPPFHMVISHFQDAWLNRAKLYTDILLQSNARAH